MLNVSTMLATLVNAVKTAYNNISFTTGEFTDIRAKGYNISGITIMSPYGQGSVPLNGIQGLLVPLNESNKTYVNMGFVQVIPDIPYTFNAGDSWSFSQNYVLAYQNSGIIAYRISDDSYNATLISGQWTNKILTDIITRLNDLETYLNTHVHIGVTTGSGSSGIPAVLLPDDPDLVADQNAIDDGETLIADGGTTP